MMYRIRKALRAFVPWGVVFTRDRHGMLHIMQRRTYWIERFRGHRLVHLKIFDTDDGRRVRATR